MTDPTVSKVPGVPHQMIEGHTVMLELLNCNIHMTPGTIDPFVHEGSALQQFCHNNNRDLILNTSLHNFGNSKGTRVGITMCQAVTRDQAFSSLLTTADKNWKLCNA
eukprot:3472623-Ditylum_brightwellii.AAC.2